MPVTRCAPCSSDSLRTARCRSRCSAATDRFRSFGEPLAEDGDGYDFEFVQEIAAAAIGGQGWAYYDFVVPDLPPTTSPGNWDYCMVTVEDLRELYCQPWVDAVFEMAD